jgi:hypothetical protein
VTSKIAAGAADGPIRDLGELFIELAGSEAINEYFEYPAKIGAMPMVQVCTRKRQTGNPRRRQ